MNAETRMGEATQPADFFQPGHTYINAEFPQYGWQFRVDSITTHPDNGERTALGWRFFNGQWEPYAYGEDDWEIRQVVGTTDTTEDDGEPAELTIYRASHDSIVMGRYTTASEARKHCETVVRREHAETSTVELWWREDEDTVDQPEDGEQELIERVKSQAVPGPGYTRPTGYVVTPLTVASAYDEEAEGGVSGE